MYPNWERFSIRPQNVRMPIPPVDAAGSFGVRRASAPLFFSLLIWRSGHSDILLAHLRSSLGWGPCWLPCWLIWEAFLGAFWRVFQRILNTSFCLQLDIRVKAYQIIEVLRGDGVVAVRQSRATKRIDFHPPKMATKRRPKLRKFPL